MPPFPMGRDSVAGIELAMGWTVWESNPGGGKIFHTRPDWPWGPNEPPAQWAPGVLAGSKAAGAWR
jgi:hypothetical protein